MATPKRTMAAVTADGERVGSVTVREITLGVAALLELAGSPLVTGRRPETLADMVPTMYIMTRPAAESQRALAGGGLDALREAAYAWADGVPTSDGVALAAACGRAAARAARTAPQGVPERGPEGNGASAGTAG